MIFSRLILLVSVVAFAQATSVAMAAEFCVESKILDGDEMVGGSTTLFLNRVAYDFLAQDAEITVFDPSHGRFVLLHPELKLKSVVTLDEIKRFTDRLQGVARASRSDVVRFLANPNFEVSTEPETQRLIFHSRWIDYRVETAPQGQAEIVDEYSDYACWQTQFNAMLYPKSDSNFTRLAVQKELHQRQVMPVRLEVVRNPGLPGERFRTLKGEHRLQSRLLASDRQRIATANEHLVTFSEVPLDEYLQRVAAHQELQED